MYTIWSQYSTWFTLKKCFFCITSISFELELLTTALEESLEISRVYTILLQHRKHCSPLRLVAVFALFFGCVITCGELGTLATSDGNYGVALRPNQAKRKLWGHPTTYGGDGWQSAEIQERSADWSPLHYLPFRWSIISSPFCSSLPSPIPHCSAGEKSTSKKTFMCTYNFLTRPEGFAR